MNIRMEIQGKNSGYVNYKGPEAAEMAITYLNSIEADEIQINIENDETKAFAEFSGESCNISTIKFIRSANTVSEFSVSEHKLTLKERLEMFLRFEFHGVWFTSLDVKREYEKVYGKINLSTVSTYLARMYQDNILERRGNHNQREYRFKDAEAKMNMEHASIK